MSVRHPMIRSVVRVALCAAVVATAGPPASASSAASAPSADRLFSASSAASAPSADRLLSASSAASAPSADRLFSASSAVSAPSADQQAPGHEEFVPLSEIPAEEQIPAFTLVAAAYAAVWLMLIGYVWSVSRRLHAVETELTALGRKHERS